MKVDDVQGRYAVDYPVQGGLLVAHAPFERECDDGQIAYFADVYVGSAMQQLWDLHQERQIPWQEWPAFLRDSTLLQGAWDIDDDWHAYAAAELADAFEKLLARGVVEPDLSRVHAVDDRPPAKVGEAIGSLVAFVRGAPGDQVFLKRD